MAWHKPVDPILFQCLAHRLRAPAADALRNRPVALRAPVRNPHSGAPHSTLEARASKRYIWECHPPINHVGLHCVKTLRPRSTSHSSHSEPMRTPPMPSVSLNIHASLRAIKISHSQSQLPSYYHTSTPRSNDLHAHRQGCAASHEEGLPNRLL